MFFSCAYKKFDFISLLPALILTFLMYNLSQFWPQLSLVSGVNPKLMDFSKKLILFSLVNIQKQPNKKSCLGLILSVVLATIVWFLASLFCPVCLSWWTTLFQTFFLSSSLITFSHYLSLLLCSEHCNHLFQFPTLIKPVNSNQSGCF